MALTPCIALCAFCRTLLSQLLALQSGFSVSMLSSSLPPTRTDTMALQLMHPKLCTYKDDRQHGWSHQPLLPLSAYSPVGMVLPRWPAPPSLSLHLSNPLGAGVGGLRVVNTFASPLWYLPSPSCLPFSYCSRLSGQFKALPRPALCIYRKSLWIWPRRTLSASRKQSWRWRQALSWSASDQTSSF